jgi:hypothetical protein
MGSPSWLAALACLKHYSPDGSCHRDFAAPLTELRHCLAWISSGRETFPTV